MEFTFKSRVKRELKLFIRKCTHQLIMVCIYIYIKEYQKRVLNKK